MTLVAISASYGAGGSRVGPAVAERLGVPFVDRAIPAAVAERLAVPLDDAAAHDDQLRASWLERILRGFIGQDTGAPAPVPAEAFSAEDFRRATEEVIRRQAASGAGVILGRAAVIVLRGHPATLRVRLDGPAELRVRQAIELEGIDAATAERRRRQLDDAHAAYVRHFYGVSLDDLSFFHVVLDSTALDLDCCAELIAQAAQAIALEPAGAARRPD
jgi:cytidylate kinase